MPASPPRPAQDEPHTTVAEAHALVTGAAEDLRSAHEDLLATQAVVELLLEVVGPVAVVEQGTVRGWSTALEAVTGITARRAIGRPPEPEVFGGAAWVDPEGRTWAVSRCEGGRGFEALVLSPTT